MFFPILYLHFLSLSNACSATPSATRASGRIDRSRTGAKWKWSAGSQACIHLRVTSNRFRRFLRRCAKYGNRVCVKDHSSKTCDFLWSGCETPCAEYDLPCEDVRTYTYKTGNRIIHYGRFRLVGRHLPKEALQGGRKLLHGYVQYVV